MYLWSELISHKSSSIWINVIIFIIHSPCRFSNFEQSGLGVKISDLESCEIYSIHVVLGGAEVVLRDRGVGQHLSRGRHCPSIL